MTKNQKIFFAAVSLIVGTAVFIYKKLDPTDSIFFPKCTFKLLTGYSCPGCGGQRALHSLLNGNFKDAFFYNPLLFLLIPYLILLISSNILAPDSKLNQILNNYITALIIFFTIVAFWILRNLV
mgnify:CR=1 FL=1